MPKILLPPDDTYENEYDNPNLDSIGFLRAIVRCRKLPVPMRVDAASKLSVFEHPRLAQQTQDVNANVTINIKGGLPDLPGTNIIMPKPSTPGED